MKFLNKKIVIAVIVITIFLLGLLAGVVLKKIKISTILACRYTVRGVDVSHHQGEIDWSVLEKEDIEFVFIKATEGSSHVDKRFEENWETASETSLKVGAYHFFSFDSEGETQAENYIKTVKPMIYTTYKVYFKYLKGEFEEYPLWIRDVYFTPDVILNSNWTFWQYTDTAIMKGFHGREKYIDVNVFKGDIEELDKRII